jgi:sarcosine oxidase subunit beta
MFPQMLGTADADFYGHQTKHGSFVFGGDSGFEDVNKDNGHDATSSITAPAICRGILRYIPKLADAKIVRTWGGYEDVCIDGVPVLGASGRSAGPHRCRLRLHRTWLRHLSDCRHASL